MPQKDGEFYHRYKYKNDTDAVTYIKSCNDPASKGYANQCLYFRINIKGGQ